ncbi:UV DNA damage repair endonuclease UvsE [Laceyella sacchari]|jgi:UV DNA damage endonuclease|uniref:UV DNA damage repair endonuclease UvsE n=1 Tax=Laceyella sacchari TaxID=37482 RepID=A0ABY5U2Y9_LACSH|nr:UV DNA damage repair endonuclease UvsE [Laceyella sacchari]TCW36170.1 UV-damage endonuclease [Laceyella sacchari]UWE03984.1 UV DNA damage repair endonuclease UvsE [Laceyella sacchari]
MIVRFGFVAMSSQVPNASPSKTMTVKAFQQIGQPQLAMKKIIRIAKENLANTKRILYHALAHDIKFYRFSSRLIPLAGHALVGGRDFVRVLLPELKEIGQLVQDYQMRVGFHPEHYTVLNTPNNEVFAASYKDLIRHVKMLAAMGLHSGHKCNIHVGGVYGNKEDSMERFLSNFKRLDARIQAHLCLENDDTTYTAAETLQLAETAGVPMVLDLHHHRLNHHGEKAEDLWPRIAATWAKEPFPPKIHISSPKSETDARGHADYVEVDDLYPFLKAIAPYTDQVDVMIEAKQKDGALFELMEQLRQKEGVSVMNQATIRI